MFANESIINLLKRVYISEMAENIWERDLLVEKRRVVGMSEGNRSNLNRSTRSKKFLPYIYPM